MIFKKYVLTFVLAGISCIATKAIQHKMHSDKSFLESTSLEQQESDLAVVYAKTSSNRRQ